MDKIKVVILAGGLGTRLHPVTLETPKPLLTVQGKPILNHLIELFKKHDIKESLILINKNHTEDYKWWQKRYQKELPQKVKIHVEPEPLGTFGGLKHIKKYLPTTFVLSNGDELKDFPLDELITFHKHHKEKPLATIALVKVDNPSDYGVPVMSGDKIQEFLEKPKNPPSNFISSGLYILEPEVFKYAGWDFPGSESSAKQNGKASRTSTARFLMIEKDIFPKLAAAGKLAGYKVENGRWFDCGTLERWEKAIREW